MLIRCCSCKKEYDLEVNIFEYEKGSRYPILICPYCGLRHIINFMLFDNKIERLRKVEKLDLTTYYPTLGASRIANANRVDQSGTDNGSIFDGIAWDVSAAIYAEKSKLVSAQDAFPYNVVFNSDGTKMYIVGNTNDTVYQYTLTAWDVSTAVYAEKSKLVTAQDTSPIGVTFSSDGTKMYIVGNTNDTVYQYTLTAWDVSTAVYADKSKLVSSQDASPRGIAFNSDGTKMYIVGNTNDTVYQYTLTAWDVSTAVYADKSKLVSSQDADPYGIVFNSDGTKMYIAGNTNDTVYQYTLSPAWDVSTAVYAEKSKLVTAQDTSPVNVAFNSDGTKMYIVGYSSSTIYQYKLINSAWTKTNDFILATRIYGSKGAYNYAYTLKWRNVTDSGSFAAVGVTGEISYSADTVLEDGQALPTGSKICSAQTGYTWQNGMENEGDNILPDSGTYSLADEYYTELQWALDCNGAHDGDKYEFALYTNSTLIGTCLATITMAAGGTTHKITGTSANTTTSNAGTLDTSAVRKLLGASVNTITSNAGTLIASAVRKLLGTSVNVINSIADVLSGIRKFLGTSVNTLISNAGVLTTGKIHKLLGIAVNTIVTVGLIANLLVLSGTSVCAVTSNAGTLNTTTRHSLTGTSINTTTSNAGELTLGITEKIAGTSVNSITSNAGELTTGVSGATQKLEGTSVNIITSNAGVLTLGITEKLSGTSINTITTIGVLTLGITEKLSGTSVNAISTTGVLTLGVTEKLSGTSVNSITTIADKITTGLTEKTWLELGDDTWEDLGEAIWADWLTASEGYIYRLVGTSVNTVYVSGLLKGIFKLTGTSENATTVIGILTLGIIEKLTGISVNTLTTTGNLTLGTTEKLLGTSVNTTTVTGVLTLGVTEKLSGTSVNVITTSGVFTFGVVEKLSGTSVNTVSTIGSLTLGITEKLSGISVNIISINKINIGNTAVDRTYSAISGVTFVDKNNPANETGTITSIEIWATTNMTGCEVATFYVESGNNLSTRDSEYIGDVEAGSKQTFAINLDVVKGDYIGIYYTTGNLGINDIPASVGWWYKYGDYITCTDTTFTVEANRIISLYATGITLGELSVNPRSLSGTSVNIVTSNAEELIVTFSTGVVRKLAGTSVNEISTTGALTLGIVEKISGTSVNTLSLSSILNANLGLSGISINTLSLSSVLDIVFRLSGTSVNVFNVTGQFISGHWTEEIKPTIGWTEETKKIISWLEENKVTPSWLEETKGIVTWIEETKNDTSWTEE